MELSLPAVAADTEMGMNQPDQAEETLRQYDIATGMQFFGNATTRLMAEIRRMGMMPEPEPIAKQQPMRLERQGRKHPWYVIRSRQPHPNEGDAPRPPQRQPETTSSSAVPLSTPVGGTG